MLTLVAAPQRLTPNFKEQALACIAESFTDPKHPEPFSWIMNLKEHHWKAWQPNPTVASGVPSPPSPHCPRLTHKTASQTAGDELFSSC